jgi:glycosyltransferase involved in cell wall biosynthesis
MLDNFECTEETIKGMSAQFDTLDIIPCKKIWFSLGKTPFDGWYVNGIGEQIRFLCAHYEIDLVLCSYIWQSKLLEFVPDHILKVIDTHDKMGNRSEMLRLNKLPPGQFSCTPEEEGAYLRRADLVIGITEEETRYFAEVSRQQNTLMISHIEPPKFLKKDFVSLRHVGIVASSNRFNLSMVMRCLHSINNLLNKADAPFMLHIVGGIKEAVAFKSWHPKMRIFKKPWIIMHGFVPNIAEFYGKMDLILSPMICGTGINIKTVEAMAYGMPLLSTIHGSRGMNLTDKMHHHENIDALVHGLFAMIENPIPELKRLAALSQTHYMEFYEQNEAHCTMMFEHPKLAAQRLSLQSPASERESPSVAGLHFV